MKAAKRDLLRRETRGSPPIPTARTAPALEAARQLGGGAASRQRESPPPRRGRSPGWPCRSCRHAPPTRWGLCLPSLAPIEAPPGVNRGPAGLQARCRRQRNLQYYYRVIPCRPPPIFLRDPTMRRIKLDKIDRRILRDLQASGRMTNVDLAKRAGISAPPCLRRVRALEEAGFIRGYHADINSELLGFGVTVFAQVGLSSQAEPDLK